MLSIVFDYKNNIFLKQKRATDVALSKCGKRDLNPHVYTDTRSLVLPVCQFQHSRIGLDFLIKATTRFELVIRVLQTHALPLGYVAVSSCLNKRPEQGSNL